MHGAHNNMASMQLVVGKTKLRDCIHLLTQPGRPSPMDRPAAQRFQVAASAVLRLPRGLSTPEAISGATQAAKSAQNTNISMPKVRR